MADVKAEAPKETPKEIVEKSVEALRLAKHSGAVRKGINEVTKSVERGLASIVFLANDIEPKEVAMHIPPLCEQRKIPLIYVPKKADLGKAAGLTVPCSSAAIEKAGEGEAQLKEVLAWVSGSSSKKGSK